ncbi:MAG: peptidoglycan editing factor PgeF [Methylobacillus sp.]|jgi:YfiH family protein|nr:peptidoglycan editing factor PgeF [Methylobacillus sp.]
MNFIIPDWPAPEHVRAIQTTRQGGLSQTPYDSLNFGLHVGDDPRTVVKNRNLLNTVCPSEPIWLEQTHGTTVALAETASCVPQADACITRAPNTVCVVMTADCLPVFLCDDAGTVAGIAHAGWRGLAAGVIEKTARAMNAPPASLMAWLGPAIGSQAFEVGAEVREVFLRHDAHAASAFTARGEKYLADLYLLARQRLQTAGITRICGGNFCTHTDAERFFSHRRDGRTGRMASLIWLSRA